MKNDIKIIDRKILVLGLGACFYGLVGFFLIQPIGWKTEVWGNLLLDFSGTSRWLIGLSILLAGTIPLIIFARLVARHKHRKNSVGVAFSAAPDWQDRYKRAVEDAGTTVEELESHIDINPIASPTRKYPVLKSKRVVADYYLSIRNLGETIEQSQFNQPQKTRVTELKALAEKVLANLQELQDIGQLDEFNNTNQHSGLTHTARAEKKLEIILTDMRSMITDQAMKLSNEIDDLALPHSD